MLKTLRMTGTTGLATRFTFVVVWIGSLIAVATAAAVLMHAQARQSLPTAPIISGADIGFRVESQRGDVRYGTLMIRVDGKWIEAGFASKLMRVK
jgi:hypothetical protein